MSSWERARYIPWTKIPRNPEIPLDEAKERIFRELQRETIEDELRQQDRQGLDNDAQDKKIKVPYSNIEMLRQAAFGGCIGSITGAVFGFMDGMRTAGESQVLQSASNAAKTKYLIQGTSRSATIFGVFFGGFHVVKYGLRVTVDPGELGEIVMAGAVSMGALMYRPNWRPSMPYAAMLVFMDGVNNYMKETS